MTASDSAKKSFTSIQKPCSRTQGPETEMISWFARYNARPGPVDSRLPQPLSSYFTDVYPLAALLSILLSLFTSDEMIDDHLGIQFKHVFCRS